MTHFTQPYQHLKDYQKIEARRAEQEAALEAKAARRREALAKAKFRYAAIDQTFFEQYACQLTHLEIALYVVLCGYRCFQTRPGQVVNECYPSQETLANTLHCEIRSIRKATRRLEALGMLTVRRKKMGVWRRIVYTLVMPLPVLPTEGKEPLAPTDPLALAPFEFEFVDDDNEELLKS